MWWAGSEVVNVFLGERRWGLRRDGAAVSWTNAASAIDAWRSASEALGAVRRASVHVWLSGTLARPFMMQTMAGLSRIGDAEKIAARLAPDEAGLQGPCCVTLENWSPNRSTLCVAMNSALRSEIEGRERTGIRIKSIRPWWTLVLADALSKVPSTVLLSMEDGESLVVLGGRSGDFEIASSCVPPPDDEQRAALVRRVLSGGTSLAGPVRHAVLASTRAMSALSKHANLAFGWTWWSDS